MFKVGTVFRYKVDRMVDGRQDGSPFEEVYRIANVDGESVKVELSADGSETQVLETRTSYGSYVFRTDGFSVQSESPLQVEFEDSVVYVDVLVPGGMRCGGSETIYLGRDGVVYKDVKTQLWSMGVTCIEARKLLSVEVDGRVYDDIRWVEGSEPEEDEDPARAEIEEFKRKRE